MEKIKASLVNIYKIGIQTMRSENASIAEIPDMMDELRLEHKELALYVQSASLDQLFIEKMIDFFDSFSKLIDAYNNTESLKDIEVFFSTYEEYENKLIEVNKYIVSYSNFN